MNFYFKSVVRFHYNKLYYYIEMVLPNVESIENKSNAENQYMVYYCTSILCLYIIYDRIFCLRNMYRQFINRKDLGVTNSIIIENKFRTKVALAVSHITRVNICTQCIYCSRSKLSITRRYTNSDDTQNIVLNKQMFYIFFTHRRR